MPTVSVITPTYNRADVLPHAIESVLYQTYSDIEYIIVDDASSDNTEEIVRAYDDSRLKYIRHDSNQRQAAARNTGIENAEGDYLAFIDSDDTWHPMKIERQIKILRARPENWIGIYCDRRVSRTSFMKNVVVKNLPYKIKKEGNTEIRRDILSMEGTISGGSTLLIQSDAANKIGGFDERLKRHEEVDFILRLLEHGKLAYIDEKLVTINESGEPDAAILEESKNILLNNFKDEVRMLESEDIPITKRHNFNLSRCFFEEGNFIKGAKYLRSGKPSNIRQMLRFSLALLNGLSKKLIGDSTMRNQS